MLNSKIKIQFINFTRANINNIQHTINKYITLNKCTILYQFKIEFDYSLKLNYLSMEINNK